MRPGVDIAISGLCVGTRWNRFKLPSEDPVDSWGIKRRLQSLPTDSSVEPAVDGATRTHGREAVHLYRRVILSCGLGSLEVKHGRTFSCSLGCRPWQAGSCPTTTAGGWRFITRSRPTLRDPAYKTAAGTPAVLAGRPVFPSRAGRKKQQ